MKEVADLFAERSRKLSPLMVRFGKVVPTLDPKAAAAKRAEEEAELRRLEAKAEAACRELLEVRAPGLRVCPCSSVECCSSAGSPHPDEWRLGLGFSQARLNRLEPAGSLWHVILGGDTAHTSCPGRWRGSQEVSGQGIEAQGWPQEQCDAK